ncbi:MAG: Ig-like domain-containing protein, partial [Solirubrobacteraceae bacterium]
MSRRLGRSRSAPQRRRGRAGRAGHAALVVATALLAICALAAPAVSQAQNDLPVQLTVTVVPPNGTPGPRPTGGVVVSVDGRRLLSLPLVRGIASLTSITPQLSIVLDALGHRVTIRYSGDSNYEASTGISVTLPTRGLLRIVARPRDSAAPAIEVLSPADGTRYARGATATASYSCRDPDDRSAVTACDGPVASGDVVDTAAEGTFAFTVRSEDALGNAASRTVTYEIGGEPDGPGGPRDPGGPDGPGTDTTGSSDDDTDTDVDSPATSPVGSDAGAPPMAPAAVPSAALAPVVLQ